jgi:hypothetical protein
MDRTGSLYDLRAAVNMLRNLKFVNKQKFNCQFLNQTAVHSNAA